MIPLGLGAAWGLVVGVWLWSRLASGERLAGRWGPVGSREGSGEVTGAARLRLLLGWCRSLLVRLGRVVRNRVNRLLAPWGAQGTAADAADAQADLHVGLGMAAGGVLAVVAHPALALVPVTAALGWTSLRARRARRRQAAAVVAQLPDVVDLLRLTTLAGLPVGTALGAIGSRPGGPVGAGLDRAVSQLARGSSTARALATLSESCGPPIQPLVDALIDHDRYGTPLGPALDRVGIESRLQRRRQAEEAARRLPVTLLFPLVFTTLPACALLTVVPLLVASLSSLRA